MVGPEFASCLLKLGRAREHFDTIKAELTTWRNSRPYSVIKQCNAESGLYSRHSLVVNLRSAPWDQWSLIAADGVSNLRAALDHLVYAFAINNAGMSIPKNARRLQFPICDSVAAFNMEIRKGRLADLGEKAQAFIERAQPYNRRQTEIPSILTILRDFNDSDKHRLLNVALSHVTDGEIKFVVPRQSPVDINWLRNPVKDGAIVAFFDLDPPEPDVDYNFDLVFDVTITHTPGPNGKHVSLLGMILGSMLNEVTDIVNGAVKI